MMTPLNALLQQGIQLDQSGQHDAATDLYRQVLEQQPDHAYALHLLGANALRRDEFDTAIELIGMAIKINAGEPNFHLFLGQALQRKDELNDALAAYERALDLAPQFAAAIFRRATVLLALQQVPKALAGFEQALGADSKFGPPVFEQAQAARDAGQLETAGKLLLITLQFHPQMQKAYVMLGYVLLAQELYSEARQTFTQLFHLERGTGWNGAPFVEGSGEAALNSNPVRVSSFFFENLIGHIEYLIGRDRLHTSFADLADIYRDILEENAGKADSLDLITLTPAQTERVRTILPRALHYVDSTPIPGAAVTPALDGAAIQRDYRDSEWRMTWFDNFLTPEALNSLREFCLGSTIFFRQSHNTFVSSYLQEGFNCSVLYQIVSELKNKFPDVLGPLHLQNIWCYRQAAEGDGVRAHSDQSEVTFNFWITADESNLDKERGGLVMYDKQQPLDWDWYKTNVDKDNPAVLERITEYLSDANTTTIPYRENRAVMFFSNMFHRSDRFCFKPGYENSRMNITLLFGKHTSLLRE